MTSPIAILYPLDLTGENPNNLVLNEPQTLLNNPNRAIVPNYGTFYTQGLIIYDAANPSTPLTKNTQYVCAQFNQTISDETGLEAMDVIVITDPSVSNNILITYQVVGGEYAYSVDALIAMLATLQLDDRSVAWGQILGKPTAYPPTQHLHDIGDTYGWEYVVNALDDLRQAILVGDQGQVAAMEAYVNSAIASLNTTLTGYTGMMSAHIADHNNPHQVTPAQIGLGLVQNYGVAQAADVIAGTATNLYVTPASLSGFSTSFNAALNAHITNLQNPHKVTAAQVNLGNVPNVGYAATADAVAGTLASGFMNPALTAAAISAQAVNPLNASLNAHINNKNNPHGTTQAQVGLGNVPNWTVETLANAQSGAGSTGFMNSQLVAAAIANQAVTPLNNHINNKNNPHNTTAGQVGAYTTAQVDSFISSLNSQLAGKQNNLGFTPVQQGGGYGQATNKIYLGWGAGLRLTVDSTDQGQVWTDSAVAASLGGSYNQVGYIKFPNGFMFNWGGYTPTSRWAEGSTGGQGFAAAFPRLCLGLMCASSINLDPYGAGAIYYDDYVRAYNITTTGFTFYVNTPSTNGYGDNWAGMTWLAWGW